MKIRNLKAQFNRKAMRVSIAVLATACVLLALIYHDETIGEWVIWLVENEGVSISAIVQSTVLVIATVVALPLALWRSIVADRQSKTASLSLLNERFRQGVAMLTGPQLVDRLGGISVLEQLAKESVESYHVPVLGQFCIFTRNPPKYKEEDNEATENERTVDEGSRSHVPALRPELQAIICALENRSNEGRAVEKEQNFMLDFSGAKLAHAKFSKGDWSSIRLKSADLSNALIENCDMKKALMHSACLARAYFINSNLSEAHLFYTDLSNALIENCDMKEAFLHNASLAGTELVRSKLSEVRLFYADLSKSRMRTIDLSKADLENCKLDEAVLHIVDLTGANLRNADLSGAEIIGVDFLGADLAGVNFSGTKLINVKNLTKNQLAKAVGKPDILPDLPD